MGSAVSRPFPAVGVRYPPKEISLSPVPPLSGVCWGGCWAQAGIPSTAPSASPCLFPYSSLVAAMVLAQFLVSLACVTADWDVQIAMEAAAEEKVAGRTNAVSLWRTWTVVGIKGRESREAHICTTPSHSLPQMIANQNKHFQAFLSKTSSDFFPFPYSFPLT